jgi:hypothetical protein
VTIIAKVGRYELRTVRNVVGHDEHLGITIIVFTNGEEFQFSGSLSCFPPKTSVICLIDQKGKVAGVAGIKKGFFSSNPASEAINHISNIIVGEWISPIIHDAR